MTDFQKSKFLTLFSTVRDSYMHVDSVSARDDLLDDCLGITSYCTLD